MSKEGTQPGQIPITGQTLVRFALENRLDRVKNTLKLLGPMKGPYGMSSLMTEGDETTTMGAIAAILRTQEGTLESKQSILRLFLKFVSDPGEFQPQLEEMINTSAPVEQKDQLLVVAREPRKRLLPKDLLVGGRRRKTHRRGRKHTRKH